LNASFLFQRTVDSFFVLPRNVSHHFLVALPDARRPRPVTPLENATPQELKEMKVRWGLDKSLPFQYAIFVKNALQGDLGTSFRFNRSALSVVLQFYLPPSNFP
jgi:peptide/nickel transport system permease protein